jgi:hypothetical protein
MAGSTDPVTVQVVHLSQLRAALKKAGPGLVEQVKQTNYDIAKDVVTSARAMAGGQGGVAPKAAASLRARKTSASAQVSLGGASAPYAYGAEFGSFRHRQFKSWRGNQWTAWGSSGVGYFLHPTIRDQREDIIKKYGDATAKIMHDAFPN